MAEKSYSFVGKYRCLSMDNVVEYCDKLGVSKMLLKLVPMAPFPQMEMLFDKDTDEFTFVASFSVGPFSFEDRHVFKTDGSLSQMKLAPSMFGATTVAWEGEKLISMVVCDPTLEADKTLPLNRHIKLTRILEGDRLIGTHELFERTDYGYECIATQRVVWEKMPPSR